MVRTVLSDGQWARMAPHCKGKCSDQGRPRANNRRFVVAVLWIVRTGAPWRDLPAELGNWKSVFKRFRAWVKGDIFKRLFDAVSDEPDMEYATFDATIVHVHRHASAQKGDLSPGHRQVQGWPDDQDRGPHRRAGQPCPVRAPARLSLRHRRCAAVDRWLGLRRPHRRQGLRFELARRRSGRSWGKGRDLAAPPTPDAPRYRLDHVWLAPSHRELLLRSQGPQTRRDPFRQDRR